MANFLPAEVVERMRQLRRDGHSLRKISRELGVSPNTVGRYLSAEDGARCECGEAAGHKGWCKSRYAESAARQAFHAKRRGVFLDVPTPKIASRVTESIREKRIWVGALRTATTPLPGVEWFGAIGEVERATRTVERVIRDDVRHEMIVACLEGRLQRKDIGRSVMTFVGFVWRGNCFGGPDPRFAKVDIDWSRVA